MKVVCCCVVGWLIDSFVVVADCFAAVGGGCVVDDAVGGVGFMFVVMFVIVGVCFVVVMFVFVFVVVPIGV